MTPGKTLELYDRLAAQTASVNETLDLLLNGIVDQKDLEARADWPEIRQTIELFMYSGMVLDNPKAPPHCEPSTHHTPASGRHDNGAATKHGQES